MKCMRVESAHACESGGYYHFYDAGTKPTFIPTARPAPKRIDAFALARKWWLNTHEDDYEALSEIIGVGESSLRRLKAGWSPEHNAWSFPMSDGNGNIVGIRLRSVSAFKWAVTGSQQGLFLPDGEQQTAYLPEGPTSTAALLSLGLYAIGRPSCNTGAEQLNIALKRLGVRRAVIVADNDELKKLGPREGRPGLEGAQKLQRDLRINSTIWIPTTPCKDVRDFLKRGGTKEMIEADIKTNIWRKQ